MKILIENGRVPTAVDTVGNGSLETQGSGHFIERVGTGELVR